MEDREGRKGKVLSSQPTHRVYIQARGSTFSAGGIHSVTVFFTPRGTAGAGAWVDDLLASMKLGAWLYDVDIVEVAPDGMTDEEAESWHTEGLEDMQDEAERRGED